VEGEGAHEEDSAGVAGGGDFGEVLAEVVDFVGGEDTAIVSAGEEADGAVVAEAVVEVEAEGEHGFEDVARGLDVGDAFFEGPGSVAGKVVAGVDGDGEILVPGDFPVGAGEFVEKDAADGEGMRAEVRGDEGEGFVGDREVVDGAMAEEIAAGVGWGEGGEDVEEGAAGGGGDGVVDDGEAVGVDGVGLEHGWSR
jgi:hypothetical protein